MFGGKDYYRIFDSLDDTDKILGLFRQTALGDFGVTSSLYGVSHSFHLALEKGFSHAIESWTDYPDRYLETCARRGLLDHEYAARHIIEQRKPIIWTEVPASSNATPAELARWELDNEFGMAVGISLPLTFGPHHGSGIGLSMSGKSANEVRALWEERGQALSRLCMSFDAAMRRVALPERFALTRREKDVLTFSVAGLSAQQIATHLGVTNRTIEGALSRARSKMGCANTTEAVAKAIIFGLI